MIIRGGSFASSKTHYGYCSFTRLAEGPVSEISFSTTALADVAVRFVLEEGTSLLEPLRDQEADLRSIRALQGAPLEGCGDDDCDDCYPK